MKILFFILEISIFFINNKILRSSNSAVTLSWSEKINDELGILLKQTIYYQLNSLQLNHYTSILIPFELTDCNIWFLSYM